MADASVEAWAYLDAINRGQCPGDRDAKINKLMALHERVVESDNSQNQMSLTNALLTAMEKIIHENDTPDGNSDQDVNAGETQREVVYNDNAADAASWAMERVDNVFFNDVIGAEDAVQVIREGVIIPSKYPMIFQRCRAQPWKGALLYGPPGTGKSLLARAAACEAGVPFFNTSCADLTSKWVGGSEKLVRGLFENARLNAPSIVFLDEIDSVASSRDGEKSIADQRLTNQLLVEIDCNANKKIHVFVLAATNLPWTLDAALMRRLPKKIYIKMPSEKDRLCILKKCLPSGMALSDDDLLNLAAASDGFSGSDLTNYANDLLMEPLRMLLAAKHFVLKRGDDGEGVVSVVPAFQACEGSVQCSGFEEMADVYGEECFELPEVTNTVAFHTLSLYRRNVKPPDTKAYETFLLS